MQIKKKILLVEDDEVLASIYRARLEMEDFEVIEVHDGFNFARCDDAENIWF